MNSLLCPKCHADITKMIIRQMNVNTTRCPSCLEWINDYEYLKEDNKK